MEQRKQAILMWRMIANNIKFNRITMSLEDFKRQFCKQRNLKWRCNCFICEHTRCENCRLHNCGDPDSAYQVAWSTHRTLEQRLRAIYSIIEAIRRVEVEAMYYISVEGEAIGHTVADAEERLRKEMEVVYKIDGITVSQSEWEKARYEEQER